MIHVFHLPQFPPFTLDFSPFFHYNLSLSSVFCGYISTSFVKKQFYAWFFATISTGVFIFSVFHQVVSWWLRRCWTCSSVPLILQSITTFICFLLVSLLEATPLPSSLDTTLSRCNIYAVSTWLAHDYICGFPPKTCCSPQSGGEQPTTV